ncbi:asparagine synthetase B family protein [Thioalkalivibrio thiocyanodenitrificans]|uniref:hypothetical protein n=1 Tax=Thioalkalivibrio thiocyanodenitrificans TaxID=243063 RepID=UPI0003818155|nr:hypothetical protein [Thioalkalivibrio thiocyanodenitrificans]
MIRTPDPVARVLRRASGMKRRMTAMLAPDNVPREHAERLLFRFGFFCHAAADTPEGTAEWNRIARLWPRMTIGEYVVYRHPETRISQRSVGSEHLVLIGDAFLPDGRDGDPLTLLAGADHDERLELLDRLGGRFALLVLRGGAGQVFHDAFGARSVCYRREGAFALSSHPEIISLVFGAGRRRDLESFVCTGAFRNLGMQSLPGDATMFDGVRLLLPNFYYDIGSRRAIRHWPRQARRRCGFEAFFGTIDRHFAGLADFLGPPVRPVVSITGGIDSRTLIAALCRHGADVRTVTWTSFNLKRWEREPVRLVASCLDGVHAEVNANNDRVNNVSLIGVRNSGNCRGASGTLAGMYRLYGEEAGALFVHGHGASAIRGILQCLDKDRPPMRDASVGEMVRIFTDRLKDRRYAHDRGFRGCASAAFERFHEIADYDAIAALGYDINDLFYWEYYMGMWASMSFNQFDTALYTLSGFNSRAVCEAAYGLPDSERLTKTLFLDVIRRYDERLAEIPYR